MNKGRLKSNRGITLVTLIITIVVIFIVAGTTVYTSLDRFEINRLQKMYNDIELLSNKVSSYYLKYNGLPVIKNSENNVAIEYKYTTLDFDKNVNDSGNYYIVDLSAMEGIALNYGKEGFNNPNASADVYIINEVSHTIYYVKGIEVDGIMYYTIPEDENSIDDTIPPTKPEIKVVSGKQSSNGIYISDVEIEIIPGKDNLSGIDKTTYTINDDSIETELTNNILKITEDGTYTIKARSYDNKGNVSGYTTMQFTTTILKIGDKVNYNEGFSASKKNTIDSNFAMKDLEWRVLDIEADGTVELISTQPTDSTLTLSGQQDWRDAETKLDTLCNDLYANGAGVTARSLKVEDVNKLGNYTPTAGTWYRYKYNADPTVAQIQYSTSSNYNPVTKEGTWSTYANTGYTRFTEQGKATISSSNYQDAAGNPIVAELQHTYYEYTVSDKIKSKTPDGILMSALITQGLDDANAAATGTNKEQWLSSRCVGCGTYGADFYVCIMYGGGVKNSSLWASFGRAYGPWGAVRPVVSLKLDAFTTKTNDIWQVSQ